MRLANFIIAGTEKAGTTAVFSYLARHPNVAVSARKETNFFRRAQASENEYALEFSAVDGEKILLEASPAYLGEAKTVAPRMRAMVPDVKLLFILREPVERFVSSYHFHRERLNLPKELGFSEYLHRCLDYANARTMHEQNPQATCSAPLDDWYLNVLHYGRYANHLRYFFALFPPEQIQVMLYDELRDDPHRFMQDLSAFLEIDPRFWSLAGFERMNVSFAGRRQWIHKLAILTNDRLEPLLRPRPRLKNALLSLYKVVNRGAVVDRTLESHDRELLQSFYAPANSDLEILLGTELPEGWARLPTRQRLASTIRAGTGAEITQ